MNTRGRHAKGQSLAEFALVMPFIALLIFGFLELGRAVYIYNTLSNAARQGARVAAVNQNANPAGVCDPSQRTQWSIVSCVLQSAVSINIKYPANIAIAYTGSSCATRQLEPICVAKVTVSYDYVPFTPIVSDIVGTIHMSSTSEMPVEAWFP